MAKLVPEPRETELRPYNITTAIYCENQNAAFIYYTSHIFTILEVDTCIHFSSFLFFKMMAGNSTVKDIIAAA